jgi:hypothetical protein
MVHTAQTVLEGGTGLDTDRKPRTLTLQAASICLDHGAPPWNKEDPNCDFQQGTRLATATRPRHALCWLAAAQKSDSKKKRQEPLHQ